MIGTPSRWWWPSSRRFCITVQRRCSPTAIIASSYRSSNNGAVKSSNCYARDPTIVGAYHTLLATYPSNNNDTIRLETSLPTRRHFSLIFRNSLSSNNQLSEEKKDANNNAKDGNRLRDDHLVIGASISQQKQSKHQKDPKQQNKRNHRHHHNHSVRLISESAARQTTQLFIDAYNKLLHAPTSSSSKVDKADINATRTKPIWKDPATLLAAEHALEYWSNCLNREQHKGSQRHNRQQQHDSQYNKHCLGLESNANIALQLFNTLCYFHQLENGTNNSNNNRSSNRNSRNNINLVLTNGMYSHIIDALAKSTNNVKHVQLADMLLQQHFISLYIANVYHNLDVDTLLKEVEVDLVQSNEQQTSVTAISGHIKEEEEDIMMKCANRIKWDYKDKHYFPNQVRITSVIRGYAQTLNPLGAESLLQLMISLSGSDDDDNSTDSRSFSRNKKQQQQQLQQIFHPNEVSYATVIDAYSRINDGVNAERILRLMKDTCSTNDGGANVVAYNAAISAWARCAKQKENCGKRKSSSRMAADNAERLLREMWQEYDDSKSSGSTGERSKSKNVLLPDVVSYSTVISAYASCLDQPYGMKRANDLVKELEGLAEQEFHNNNNVVNDTSSRHQYRKSGRHPRGFQPNTMVYNTLLQAYANVGDASTAENILQSMITLHTSSMHGEGGGGPYQHVRPNIRTFNVVLNACSKSCGELAGARAMKLLDRLENMDDVGTPHPDIFSYNTVLAAWSKSASVADGGDSAVSPSNEDYESSLRSIVGERAAYEALKLLDKVEDQYIQSSQHNNARYNDDNHRTRVVKPDATSYSTAIAAFANAAQHSKDGVVMAEKAEEILSRMKDKLINASYDTYGINGVLLAWARSSGGLESAQRAEAIFRSMRKPTIVSWSIVINAYAHADSAHKAESLLKEMERNVIVSSKQRDGKANKPIIPTVLLYNNVLHSWGRSSESGASKNAEMLLQRMENISDIPNPDSISYRIVLTALEHSLDPDKAERAKSVLDRFLALDEVQNYSAKPTEIQNAYNSVLTACAYTPADAGQEHRSNAAIVLAQSLRGMNQFPWSNYGSSNGSSGDVIGPNQETYALFIQGCTHLYEMNSKEQTELLMAAFRECRQKGLLSKNIWQKLPKEVLREEFFRT